MKKLLLTSALYILSFIILFDNSNSFPSVNKAAGDSCDISGPASVVTNINVIYITTAINFNWEVYSYNGAFATIVRANFDTLEVNTGTTPGNYTVYSLSNPGGDVLCSLNVNVDAALPVELNSFTSSVNKRNVTLNWSTSSEENNSGFEIDRANVNSELSIVNGQWSRVGFFEGYGNSNILRQYTFEDKNLNTGRFKYRLKQLDYNGNFRYFELENEIIIGIPEKFSMSQNYPNPFNPVTKINYDIAKDGNVKIIVFDINGREIKTLINEFKAAGYYTIDFDGASLSSGMYFYRFESGNFSAVRKMFLIK